MSQRWSTRTETVLRRAGWRPGRAVPTVTWESVLRERGGFAPHEAARRFLAEFGGLVTYGWPADTIATSSAISFDPLTAEWQDERFARASREAGAPLYPVGTADEGATLLGLGEDGSLHLLRDQAEFLSTTTDQALDRLVDMQATASALWKPSGGAADDHAFWRRVDTVDPAPDTTSPRWPAETDRVLRAAGWSPGRAVPTDTWESILLETGGFELHDAARRFLAEFGALRVPHREPWDEMPWREFSLDPLLAFWDTEIIEDLSDRAGAALYPIGMHGRRNSHLTMAEDGAVYEGMDDVWLLAASPDQAMERITRRNRPTTVRTGPSAP
ncbi:SUKH-3 domain-containing protein [Streptomyces sp. NPDC048568]|uniref:SUKH-3 domain-containing protein n=1 Tax=Streptomyces sp. NPDC048568 TaxID=3365571 RepID=UPI0037185E75